MAWVLEDSVEAAQGTNAASATFTLPGGTPTDGWLLILGITAAENWDHSFVWPAGWTVIAEFDTSSTIRGKSELGYKIASSESSGAFTVAKAVGSGDDETWGRLWAFSGAHQTTPFQGAGYFATTVDWTGQRLDMGATTETADVGDLVIQFYTQNRNSFSPSGSATFGVIAPTAADEEGHNGYGSSTDVGGGWASVEVTTAGKPTAQSHQSADSGAKGTGIIAIFEKPDAGGADQEPSLVGGKLVGDGLLTRHLVQ